MAGRAGFLMNNKRKNQWGCLHPSFPGILRLMVAISLCICLSYLLLLFYGIYLTALQRVVQIKEDKPGGPSRINNDGTGGREISCIKRTKIVYLKTHKVSEL